MPDDDSQPQNQAAPASSPAPAQSPQFVDLTKAEQPLPRTVDLTRAEQPPELGPDTRPLSPPGSPLADDEVFAFTPQGERIRIHADRLPDVVKHGGIPGIRMLDPNGEAHTVPVTRMKEAMANKMTMPPQPTDHADKHGYGFGGTMGYIGGLMSKWDFWGRVASDVGSNLTEPVAAQVRRPLTPQGTAAITREPWQAPAGPPQEPEWRPSLGQRAVGVAGALAGARSDVYQQRAAANDAEGVASQAMADIVTNLMLVGAGEAVGAAGRGLRATRAAPAGAGVTAEQAITEATARAAQETGLPTGTAAQPAVPRVPAVPGTPRVAAVPATEDVGAMEASRQTAHAEAHQGIRETFAKAATDEGVDPAPPDTPLRNLPGHLRQQIWDRSSALFQKLDEKSGGRWQRFNDAIANNERVESENIGIDNEKAAKAGEEAERLTAERDAMLQELIQSGEINSTDEAQATKDFATQKSLLQVQKIMQDNIRPATAMRAEEITNPDAMEKRLQALFDQPRGDTKYSGERLQRALGDQNAETLLTHMQKLNDQLDSMERFKSMIGGTPEIPATPGIPAVPAKPAMSATGLAKFREIVQRATGASPRLVGGKQVFVTDWGKAHKAFINMSDGEKALAFGQKQRDVGEFLAEMAESQAREARRMQIRKGLWKAAGAGALVTEGVRGGAELGALATAGKIAGAGGYLLGKEVVRRGVRAVQAAKGETEQPPVETKEPAKAPSSAKPSAAQKATAIENPNVWEAFPDDEKLADQLIKMEGPLTGKGVAPEHATNPGNLKDPKTKQLKKFSSYEEGRKALVNMLKDWRQRFPNWTIADLNRRYAPDKSHGGDNPEGTEEGRNRQMLEAIAD